VRTCKSSPCTVWGSPQTAKFNVLA
jgi:hypothetical protein